MYFNIDEVNFLQTGHTITIMIAGLLPSPAFSITGRSASLEGLGGSSVLINITVTEKPGIWAQVLKKVSDQIILNDATNAKTLEYRVMVNGQLARSGVAAVN